MALGLTIRIVDPDDDYLGIEICASNERFSGSARIYSGLDELSAFAAVIAGFPLNAGDKRVYEFASREPSAAGGYCSLSFHSVDRSDRAVVEVDIGGDGKMETAHLSFRVEPAAVDRFTTALRGIESRFGETLLPAAG